MNRPLTRAERSRRLSAVTVPMRSPGIVERELSYWGKTRSAAVILFLSRFEQEALDQALDGLVRRSYLSNIVLVLTDASTVPDGDLLRAHSQAQSLRVIRSNSQRLQALQSRLDTNGLALPAEGRARALWYALGYLMAASPAEAVAVHEGPQLKPELLSDSLYPLLSPYGAMQICKVCGTSSPGEPATLLSSLLFEALAAGIGSYDYLQCLASFFHPWSLGLAFRRNLMAGLRLPAVGTAQLSLLSELQRRVPINDLCQVDARSASLQPSAAQCWEFAALLLENLRSEGMVLSSAWAHSLKLSFQELALDQLAACRSHCEITGLAFNEHEAELFVERFADIVFSVGCQLADGKTAHPTFPSWKRTMHAFPDVLTYLNAAVEQDFAELSAAGIAVPPPALGRQALRRPRPRPRH